MRTTRKKFNLILALVMMLTMAQTAWATTTTVTRTVTWKMDGGASGETTKTDDYTLYTTVNGANNSLHWTCNDPNPYNSTFIRLNNTTFFGDHYTHTDFMGDVLNSDPTIEFLDIEGTVTKVEMVNFQLYGDIVQVFVGKNKNNTSTLLHLENTTDDYYFQSIGGIESGETFCTATFVGNVAVDRNNQLKILFFGTVKEDGKFCNFDFKSDGSGYISVTYETEEEVTGDPGHTFSYTTSGNTLTATCNQTDPNHTCELTNRKATLTLTADDVPYNATYHTASVNKQDFVNATGITDVTTTFSYKNKSTNEVRTNGVYEIGDYTVTATVTISGTEYTLTKDFSIIENIHSITNNCPQLILNRTTARPNDEVHITVDYGFKLTSLSATGATANLTVENHGIWYSDQNGFYWFHMPDEDVTINATWKKSLNNSDITVAAIDDQTYTGSAIEPSVTVLDGETDITDQCDITFSNNTNVGMATVTITAKAESTEYSGSTTAKFDIVYYAVTLADNANNSTTISTADGKVSAVTLQDRTLYKDGDWNTLTLPFALSAAEIAASPLAGATIMTLDGTTSNLDGEGLLTLNFETAYDPTIAPSGSIVAGRPYIVKWKPQADLFINSADDWNDFCTRVNNGTESYSGKTVRLTSNISVTKMAGTHSNPFCGTFEGDGYTIEVTLNNNGDTGTSDESYGVAPFRFTSGATIRNLHVGGTITTSTRKYAGGIVGKTVSGTNNIQNCWVSAEIYSTINGDGTHGGFVGKVSGTANITNCLFDGVLTTASGNITNKCGGFVGWREGTLSISNSLYAPAAIPEGKYTIGTTDTYTFTRNNSSSYNTDNCLYTQALGGAQGTNASAMSNDDKLDKLGSGWKISNGHVVPKMEAVAMPNIVNPVFQNVTVEDPANTEVSFNGGEFVGNFAPLEITDANRNSVVLLAAGNKLGYAKTDRTIANGKALGACRAYFHIPAISGNALARRFVMNFGEEDGTTGIIEVTANQKSTPASGIYTLDGRKLQGQPTQRGIYIVNGKKIIVK